MRHALLLLALCPTFAAAADIVGARYDRVTDALVVDLAYRGTTPGHDFSLEWGNCEPGGPAAARLVDRQGTEPAHKAFRVRERFDLAGSHCRPAQVTLRLGRVSHATVRLAETASAVPKPWVDVLASDLLGSEVVNARGERLGTIEDIVVDLPGKEVDYVVLSFDPALGLGEERFAFSITALAPIIGTDRLQLTVPRSALERAGGFAPGRPPLLRPGQARASKLLHARLDDLVLNFSANKIRAIVKGEPVP